MDKRLLARFMVTIRET